MVRKSFFRVPEAGEILRLCNREISEDLVEEISGLRKEESVTIMRNLVPGRFETSGDFMKSYRNLAVVSDVSKISRGVIGRKPRNGYVVRRDDFFQRFSLYEDFEGDKIIRYCDETGFDHLVRNYFDGGLEILAINVPSREEGRADHKIEFGVVSDGDGYDLVSRHECGAKKFSFRNRVCAHDFVGYVRLMEKYGDRFSWRVGSQILRPSEEGVRFYDKLDFNCLIWDGGTGRARRLLVAEKEILLWGFLWKGMKN